MSKAVEYDSIELTGALNIDRSTNTNGEQILGINQRYRFLLKDQHVKKLGVDSVNLSMSVDKIPSNVLKSLMMIEEFLTKQAQEKEGLTNDLTSGR